MNHVEKLDLDIAGSFTPKLDPRIPVHIQSERLAHWSTYLQHVALVLRFSEFMIIEFFIA